MGDAAVEELSETEDSINLASEEEEEEQEEEKAHDDEVVNAKASSPMGQNFTPPSRSPSPVQRLSLADISNVPQLADTFHEVEELKQTVRALKERLGEMETRTAQCTSPPFPSWSAMSMPLPISSFPPNPWAYSMPAMMPFTPAYMMASTGSPAHMMASTGFETPRSSLLEVAFDDGIEFDEVFSNYGSASPLKIRREVVEDCWRKACSQSNFAMLLARKAFSEKERATSNCTGDHRYKKKALSPNRIEAVKEAIASVQPQQPGQKPEEWWKPYKDAINASCRGLCRRQKASTHYSPY